MVVKKEICYEINFNGFTPFFLNPYHWVYQLEEFHNSYGKLPPRRSACCRAAGEHRRVPEISWCGRGALFRLWEYPPKNAGKMAFLWDIHGYPWFSDAAIWSYVDVPDDVCRWYCMILLMGGRTMTIGQTSTSSHFFWVSAIRNAARLRVLLLDSFAARQFWYFPARQLKRPRFLSQASPDFYSVIIFIYLSIHPSIHPSICTYVYIYIITHYTRT